MSDIYQHSASFPAGIAYRPVKGRNSLLQVGIPRNSNPASAFPHPLSSKAEKTEDQLYVDISCRLVNNALIPLIFIDLKMPLNQ